MVTSTVDDRTPPQQVTQEDTEPKTVAQGTIITNDYIKNINLV